MKVEYSIGRVACWRLPKLLNPDISTIAMTSHNRRFLVRLFKYYLLNFKTNEVGLRFCLICGTATAPIIQYLHFPMMSPDKQRFCSGALIISQDELSRATHLMSGRTQYGYSSYVKTNAVGLPKSPAHKINFLALRARRRRFARDELFEAAAQLRVKLVKPCALKGLDQQRTSRLQRFVGKIERKFRQIHAARLIHGGHTAHIGGHVRDYKIHRFTLETLH